MVFEIGCGPGNGLGTAVKLWTWALLGTLGAISGRSKTILTGYQLDTFDEWFLFVFGQSKARIVETPLVFISLWVVQGSNC